MTKVLLYSGGMDSWLIDKLWKPDVKIYININGSYSAREIESLPSDVMILDFPLGQFEQPSKFVPLRNLYFLMLASNFGDEICLGATAGDWGSKDKTPEFFEMAEDMLNFLWGEQSKVAVGRKIHIETKYLYKFKNELVDEYLEQGGKVEDIAEGSFSCFNPIDGKPCMACKPCFRKYVCLKDRGMKYSDEDELKMFEFIRKYIVPKSQNINATYYSERGKEGKVAERVVNSLYTKYNRRKEDDVGL